MSLTPLDTPLKIRRFEVYDFEWIPGTLEIRLCGRYNERGYQYYLDVNTFLNNILTYSNRGKWFFAHAGGLADVQFIFEKIVENPLYTIEASFSGSSAIIVKVIRDKHVWCFCDSYWLFRDSLANIGDAIGIKKTGPTNEVNMTETNKKLWYANVPLEELIPYNERDCLILYKAIQGFQELLLQEQSILQKTIASCGMQLFRRNFLKQSIRTSKGINDVARQTYHASRVEVLSHKCYNALYYDVNSSFPYSMLKPQPGNLIACHNNLPDYLLQKIDRSYMVKANITIPECFLPPIPYREKGRLFFPFGSWTSWFIDVDFELLISEGCRINKVYESMEFDTFEDLASYSMSLYDKRKRETSKFGKILYKYLLNSVYGKLAERPEKQKLWINPPFEVLATLSEDDEIYPNIFLQKTYQTLEHVHVPISSRITAFSRKLLYDFMSNSSETYYCDTDGFATIDEFITGNEIGNLKMEKEIIHGEFYSPKVYSLTVDKDGNETTIVHAKGFSLGKQDTEDKRQEAIRKFKLLVEHKEIEVERMCRLRENLRTKTSPTEKIFKKVFTDNIVPKRFFYPDGQSRPWNIKEIKSFT